jgi:pyruvate dehydrogenase E1 component alpha subunit
MSDPAKYRSKEEVEKMRTQQDPIDQLAKLLVERGAADEASLKKLDREVKDVVTAAAEFAQQSPEPDPSELYTDVLLEA